MRFILAILFAIGLIAVIFVLIFRGGNNNTEQSRQIDLNRYVNTDASVILDVDGRVNANQKHVSYRISVNRNEAAMQVYNGYEKTVTASQTYPNNQVAYTSFIKSISILGFTNVDAQSRYGTDERGFCPDGYRYVYRLTEGSREIVRGWNTSCSGQGSFRGNSGNIRSLFNQQIPDYSKLLVGTGL